jgi:DNA-binding NarL/FixJ family response regulator
MSTQKVENVIIADTQFLVVESLRNLVEKEEQYRFCGIAEARIGLMNLLAECRSGLLITDPAAIDLDSLADLKMIRDKFPQVKVLILTNSIGKSEFLSLSKFGIKNILYKNADRSEILAAMQASLKGKKYYSEEIIDLYMDFPETKFTGDEPRNVTASEIEIIRLIANGLTTKEIAGKRNISSHTVSTHRKNIFRKIGVSNASELIMHAIKAGWIDNIEYYI